MCDLGCCHSMLASFLCLLNTVSLAVGATLTGIGIYGLLVTKNYFNVIGLWADEPIFASSVLITLGSMVLIISFIGCCGTCTETSWLVRSYRLKLVYY